MQRGEQSIAAHDARPATTASATPFMLPPAPFIAAPSRRSVVHSTNGIVACTQPLAAQAGLNILRQGGNAAVGHPRARLSVALADGRGRA